MASVPAVNVILFGETGSGKSSIINMLAGSNVAETSSRARDCTFEHQTVPIQVHGRSLNISDTAGLNEGEGGAVDSKTAMAQLYKLIVSLDGGVNLLMFCMRGPRIKNVMHQNWKLFNDIL